MVNYRRQKRDDDYFKPAKCDDINSPYRQIYKTMPKWDKLNKSYAYGRRTAVFFL
jgi:hypothetical protein